MQWGTQMRKRVLFLAQRTESVLSTVPAHGSGAHVAASLAALQMSFDVVPVFADDDGEVHPGTPSRLRAFVPGQARGLRQDVLAVRQDKQFTRRALEAARRLRPDLVYARDEYFALSSIRVARELGVPLVLEVNGLLAADAKTMYRSPAELIGDRIERRKLAAADAIVTVSIGLAERLVALGAKRNAVTVVPNAVPDARVAERPRRAGDSQVIGWIGHLMSWHADALLMLADVAPQVLERVPRARFMIAGDGPRLAEVQGHVRARGVADAFDFVGEVPYCEVPQALREVDFGVIPDVFDYAFPVKLVELGAAGVAVAAPASPELDAMLRPGTEYRAFTRHDRPALADAIVTLALDTRERDRLAAGLHAAVQARFTWSAIAAQLEHVVERVLA